MKVIPAIDLLEGKCVRLKMGEKENCTVYETNPFQIAEEYTKQGAKLLHVIDLDGAFTGKMKNLSIIEKLAASYSIEVGGGIRSENDIKVLLDVGVNKVISSTLLLTEPTLASKLKERYYGKLIGAFDFRDDALCYAGWTKQSNYSFNQVVAGLPEIMVTDITKDGTYKGPNLALYQSLRKRYKGKIIAAGGIRDLVDLIELRGTGVDAAIVGRAFLDNVLSLRDAFKFEW
ncbi:1-(5-phosphoribosyl)-5-[(5-phosphoribosylamino)methylideneamino] imidazole-4-carboxamide isomerase [Candidatus Micrarchaeota archaeon]|nr:1-(5-phosphoribosyl)-5-[(5-phosphoribosylamino)methylideneamino] imidazole-4-carboxamide isomerase [Candidatus Micrarchaeota archaeon]